MTEPSAEHVVVDNPDSLLRVHCSCGYWGRDFSAHLRRVIGDSDCHVLRDDSRDMTVGVAGEQGEPLDHKVRDLTALAYLVVTCEALGIEGDEEWDAFMYARAIHRRVRAVLSTSPGKEPCPSCDLGLATPGTPGHVCYTYAEQAARVKARQEAEGLVMPNLYESDQA